MFLTLIKTLLSTLTTHRSLALENLALRQQNTKSRTLTQGLRKSLLNKVDGIFGGTTVKLRAGQREWPDGITVQGSSVPLQPCFLEKRWQLF